MSVFDLGQGQNTYPDPEHSDHAMKSIRLILLILACAFGAEAAAQTVEKRFAIQVDEGELVLSFVQESVERKSLKLVEKAGDQRVYLNGRPVRGTVSGDESKVVVTRRVTIERNKKKIVVPAKALEPLLNLSFGSDRLAWNTEGFRFAASQGKSLLLVLPGGDGVAAYQLALVVSPEGKTTCFSTGIVP